jgi:hypothetical protein
LNPKMDAKVCAPFWRNVRPHSPEDDFGMRRCRRISSNLE